LRGLVQSQPFSDAAANAGETAALNIVIDHVKRIWQAQNGAIPSDIEIKELLALAHVQTLDVENGGAAEREAKDLLRGAVLREPAQADVAWNTLVTACERLAATKSGMNRAQLQKLLLDSGINIQATRSYRVDIDRLKAYSILTSRILNDLANIKVGAVNVKIQRPVVDDLRRHGEAGSLLVVGEPGAGKSGALHDLVQSFTGMDVVYLAVDLLGASSLGTLRQELGIDHELTEVLANWTGIQPAFLVIDALDAARGAPVARTLQSLMKLVLENGGRWRVIASIRKFDLRYGDANRDLFEGAPPSPFADPEFPNVRHLNVPILSDLELALIEPQAPALHELVSRSPEQLRALLRVPFNLRLLAALLGDGVPAADLTPIKTQIELLERYWRQRVIRADGQADAREDVLSRTCEEMTASRSLRAERAKVVQPSTGLALDSLLSHQVLSEWQETPWSRTQHHLLAFPHNLLFDYSVARLLLRRASAEIVALLVAQPDLVLFFRPSLSMHFQHLWSEDRTQFWDLTFKLMHATTIPEVAKLVGPTVASALASSETADVFDPLYRALADPEEAVRNDAHEILKHVIGSLLPETLK